MQLCNDIKNQNKFTENSTEKKKSIRMGTFKGNQVSVEFFVLLLLFLKKRNRNKSVISLVAEPYWFC